MGEPAEPDVELNEDDLKGAEVHQEVPDDEESMEDQ